MKTSKLSKAFVRAVALPSWWSDEIVDEDAGFDLAVGYISARLGLDMAGLYENRVQPLTPPTRFKKNRGVHSDDMKMVTAIGASVGRAALEGVTVPFVGIPPPAEIRSQLLSGGAGWIRLENLVEYLWARGVPVLRIAEETKGIGRRPQAMVFSCSGRPVVLLFKKHGFESLFLHDIAHEMGHIHHSHVSGDEVYVDEEHDMKDSSNDRQEIEANSFAWRLLGGTLPSPGGDFHNAQKLARVAEILGQLHSVSPGVFIRQVVHKLPSDRQWLANKACKLVDDPTDAINVISCVADRRLDFSEASADTVEFVRRMCGLGESGALSDRH